MAVEPKQQEYDLVVRSNGREFLLNDLMESIGWEESLEEAAQRLKATFLAEENVAAILRSAELLVLNGLPFGAQGSDEIWRGIPWEVSSWKRKAPRVDLVSYDHLIYPAQNEDDLFYAAGQTATGIIRASATSWQVPLGVLAETGTALKQQVHRGSKLWRLWFEVCKETAKKGGGLFRPRMTKGNLELVRLGSNQTIWLLEIGANIIEAQRTWRREGMVTQAKVVGQASDEAAARPVLAVHADADLVKAHGVLQRILSDPDVDTVDQAATLARQAVRGPEESMTVEAPDINTLRAGDAVEVQDRSGERYRLIVDRVQHEGSRGPGRMSLTLSTEEQIRWRWITP